jgi:hypothetical protein
MHRTFAALQIPRYLIITSLAFLPSHAVGIHLLGYRPWPALGSSRDAEITRLRSSWEKNPSAHFSIIAQPVLTGTEANDTVRCPIAISETLVS